MRPSGDVYVRSLHAGYGGLPVLRDLDAEFAAGAVTVVVGSNGSGKSTLLKVLSGELEPLAGSVEWGAEAPRHSHGLMPQDVSLYPRLSLRQHLKIASLMWGAAGSATSGRALRDVGLAELLDVPVGRLSGGQQRIVSLLWTVAAGPTFLLLDEPTAGLDSEASQVLVSIMNRLRADGVGIILATHDTELALLEGASVRELRDGQLHLRTAAGRVARDVSIEIHLPETDSERLKDLRGSISRARVEPTTLCVGDAIDLLRVYLGESQPCDLHVSSRSGPNHRCGPP
ncbi:MAG: ABC transporter ATP-binding protein [bacterium]|nr:ABC transporter ATP-binding protein [bacterium]